LVNKKNPVGRPPKRKDQRKRILEEAAKLFATMGYERCSMMGIAASLDISKSEVYHYFSTKQEIYDSIQATNIEELHAHVVSKINKSFSSSEQFKSMMLAHAEYFDANYWKTVAQISGRGGLMLQNFIKYVTPIREDIAVNSLESLPVAARGD
jgi:AcrR family transcriptional regulator